MANDPDKRSSMTVQTDRWDREAYAAIRQELREVPAAADALSAVTPTAYPEMSDFFALMHKASPELKDLDEVRDDHRVNLAVNAEVLTIPEIQELHRYTRGDTVGAAMALVKMEPELEVIFDRQKHNQQLAERVQMLREQLMQKLQELAQQAQDGDQGEGGEGGGGSPSQEPGSEGAQEGPSLEDEIDALEQALKAAEQLLKDGLSQQDIHTRAALQQAVRGASEDARTNLMNAVTWGTEPGVFRRLPADIRIKMAKELNTPRLRAIAEQFGPMRNIAMSPKIRLVPGMPQEVVGVTFGSDLARLTPNEMLRFADEDQEFLFLLDFARKQLQQWKMQGKEKVGKGGIIYCCDCSGSMSGQREIWAKALGLVLLNIAKADQREFHWINFGSPDVYEVIDFTRPEHFTMDGILRVAEYFVGAGTDFATPLRQALKILRQEHASTGKVESDIVFATDGEWEDRADFIERFLADLHEIDGTVWGVQIDDAYFDSLARICEDKVTDVRQFTAEGSRALHGIFSGVRAKGHKDAS